MNTAAPDPSATSIAQAFHEYRTAENYRNKTCSFDTVISRARELDASAPAAAVGGERSLDASRRRAAVETLQNIGYTWHGGQLWKPPIGPRPRFLDATPAAPVGGFVVEAWLIERLDGKSEPYQPLRSVVDHAKYNASSDKFWASPEAKAAHKITPLVAASPAAQSSEDTTSVLVCAEHGISYKAGCKACEQDIDDLSAQSSAKDGVRVEDENHKLDTDTHVFFYEQDFYVLSNFSAFSLQWKGRRFDTSEAAYHWEKFPDAPEVQDMLLESPSAHEAFKLADSQKCFRRMDWDHVKVGIMREILTAKAQQHEYVRRKLLATGDRILVEDSWRDDYWGWGPKRDGQNMLGKLWMEVRENLRREAAIGREVSK